MANEPANEPTLTMAGTWVWSASPSHGRMMVSVSSMLQDRLLLEEFSPDDDEDAVANPGGSYYRKEDGYEDDSDKDDDDESDDDKTENVPSADDWRQHLLQ